MTGWLYLAAAGALEIVWASSLKLSEGFSRPLFSAVAILSAIVSFALLALALRTLPVGTAYAIWVGIGVGGVALFGVLILNEPVTLMRAVSFALVLIGLVGLKLADG